MMDTSLAPYTPHYLPPPAFCGRPPSCLDTCRTAKVVRGDPTEDQLRAVLKMIFTEAEKAKEGADATDGVRAAVLAQKAGKDPDTTLTPAVKATAIIALAGLAAYYYTKHSQQHKL